MINLLKNQLTINLILSMEKENIEETQLEEQTSQETVNEDVQNETSEESTEKTTESTEETTDEKDAEIERLKKLNSEMAGRLKRTKKTENKTNEQGDNLELFDFLATNGENAKERYKIAQVIMKGMDCSLEEAVKDPLYLARIEKIDAEKKEEAAQIDSKKRVTQQTEGAGKPDLSRDDHKKLAMESAKKLR